MKQQLSIFLFCLLFSLSNYANNNIVIPAESQMKYTGQHKASSMFLFQGTQQLSGQLRVRWHGETGTKKTIYLDFMPDQKSIATLPYIQDEYNNNPKIIHLNILNFTHDSLSDQNDQKNRKIVKYHFKNIPQNFWRYQEGVLQAPISITIGQFAMGVECDRRYYYATIVALKPMQKTSASFPDATGCSEYGFDDRYATSSKDGYVNLRSNASTQSKIIAKLPNHTHILKIRTENDQWYYVQTGHPDQKNNRLKGYIHKSQLKVVN